MLKPKSARPALTWTSRRANRRGSGRRRGGPGGAHPWALCPSVARPPPLVGVAIARKARAHGMIGTPRFGVSVLAAGQASVSDHLAARPVAPPAGPLAEPARPPAVPRRVAHVVALVPGEELDPRADRHPPRIARQRGGVERRQQRVEQH